MRNKKRLLSILFCFAIVQGLPEISYSQISNFTTVSTEKVLDLEALHQKASDLVLKNDFEGAIRAYSDILLIEPDDETAYTGLGQIYLVLGQYKKSNEAFKNALHINPENEVAAFGIQKIMDPDGMEGMVSRQQDEWEELAAHLKPVTPASSRPPVQPPTEIKIPNFFAPAKMDKRSSAARVIKKIQVPERPASAPQSAKKPSPAPVYILRKNITVSPFQRPGLLHAKRMQMALKNAGFYEGPVNGMVGGTIKKALRAFQKNQGLPQTGKLNSRTWAALSHNL